MADRRFALRRLSWVSISFLVVLLIPLAVQAQTYGRLEGLEARGAAYVYAKPGEPTIRVSVTGDVRAPGIYEVNESFDLSTILAFAGGVVSLPEQEYLMQRTVVRLVRGAERTIVYEGEWTAMQTATSIRLADGDQVQARLYTRRVRTWRDDAPLYGLGISAGLVVLQIINLLK